MKDTELKEMLDKAEIMGFDRGVETVFLSIFTAMEESKMLVVSYKSLKELYKEIKNKITQ